MGGKGLHGPYGIVARLMQTSLKRRQRHRRNGAARRGSGGTSAVRRIALAVPLFLFSSFLVLGIVGLVGAVSAYAYYSRDLPDPAEAFNNLVFDSPSTILDRTGQVELARFGEHRREIVGFTDIPPEMIDATTAIEDKDFWTNPGFDLGGFISATIDTVTGHPRGGSTITQQLVRARLLPDSAFSGSVYDRKIKEIIQSIRLTQAFNGQDGKQKIITAYLNQNFYGNQSYGVEAAAQGYFGKDVKDLTLAQMALLAALPQSPSDYDLVRNAVEDCTIGITADQTCPDKDVRLVVPQTSPVVQRRNMILDFMTTRSVLSGSKHTPADYQAAKNEEVVLASQVAPQWKAPQFVWQVREQLGQLLCGVESKESCEKVDTGGYQVTTTLDWKIQQTTEKWLYVTARAPLAKDTAATKAILKKAGVPSSDYGWLLNLRGKNIHNDAGVVVDYRTGQILGYGGSAGYYLQTKDKQFSPEYDILSDAFRQMGSAVKPVNYTTGIDDGAMTASTVFMDVVTDFGGGFTPQDADKLERGPVRLRSALQFSLNIPAIKASFINGLDHLFQRTKEWGFVYPDSIQGAVPSEAIGTLEMHAIDLTSAFGAIADGGVLMPRTTILQIKDRNGQVVYPTPDDKATGKRVASQQAAYIVGNILEGNTIDSQNAYWARWKVLEKGKRRPAAYKTGTTDDNKDITAFGFAAPPDDPNKPGIVVGVWMGNSDNTPAKPVTSVASSGALWNHIITDATKGTPIAEFKRPTNIVEVKVDAYSGQLPGPYTTKTVNEIYVKGTEPKQHDTIHVPTQIDSATGLRWHDGCAGPETTRGYLNFDSLETQFPEWQKFSREWTQRAARGAGVYGGPKHTATSYFFDGFLVPFGRSWGGSFAPSGTCTSAPPPPTCGTGSPEGSSSDSQPPPCPTEPPGPSGVPGPTPTPTASHGKPTPAPKPTNPPGSP
jgi:membrane peptidoglycan carboxypeptidase